MPAWCFCIGCTVLPFPPPSSTTALLFGEWNQLSHHQSKYFNRNNKLGVEGRGASGRLSPGRTGPPGVCPSLSKGMGWGSTTAWGLWSRGRIVELQPLELPCAQAPRDPAAECRIPGLEASSGAGGPDAVPLLLMYCSGMQTAARR